MPTTMKNYIFTFLFFTFFLSLVACQTTRVGTDTPQTGKEEEEVADVISEGDTDSGDEDLESEFSDSEDFEQEMADDAFPSENTADEGEGEKVEVAKEEVEELEKDAELEEVVADQDESPKEEDTTVEVVDEDEILEIDSTLVSEETTDSPSADSAGVVINSIRYEAGENKIYVDSTGSVSYQLRENKSNNQVVIEISEAVLSESLQERPFVMKDFNTEMAFLQADQKDSNTVRIVLQMRGNAGVPSVNVSETGSLVISPGGGGGMSVASGGFPQGDGGSGGGVVSPVDQSSYSDSVGGVLPAKSLEEFFLHTPQFTGRPISIHLKDVGVRDVLYFISEGTGLNMVLSDDVQGNISIKLRNVPWDQALVTVMKTKKLGYLREGNVIRIMSLESLKKDQEDIKKMMESQKILDPLKVKVIPLVYAQADGIKNQLEGMTTKDRGRIVVDTHSNALIVTDISRVIDRIETMIKNLDKSPMQVMIEAKIVEARESFVRNLGISWRFNGAALSIVPGGNPQLALNMDGGLEVFPGGVGTGRTAISNFNVSFAPFGDLDLALGLSEAENLIHVISAPRMMVLNGETAKITQKSEDIDESAIAIPGAGGATEKKSNRTPAALEFEVSPQITALGSVFMKIRMKREFFGPPESSGGARPVNSREAETKVLVNNGQTIVIGGIYQKDETQSTEGFPILRHIPVLKWLFSNFTTDESRNELLLFLTPRVMDFASAESSTKIN